MFGAVLGIDQDDAKRRGESEKLGFEAIKKSEKDRMEKRFKRYSDGDKEKGMRAFNFRI